MQSGLINKLTMAETMFANVGMIYDFVELWNRAHEPKEKK